MAESLASYLKKQGIYTPQPGSLAEYLGKQKTKKVSPTKTVGNTPTTVEEITRKLMELKTKGLGIQSELSKLAERGKTPIVPTTPAAPVAPTGLYDIGKIQTELTTASESKKRSYDELIGLQSKLYEDEYSKAGLGDLKTKISSIDTDITNRKSARDQALLDEKGKPIPQWMITGRKALEIEAATNDINRSIDERNSIAGQYNEGIENVTRKVGYGISDAQTKYSFWESEEKRLSDLVGTYQSLMVAELGARTETERWETEFGLKLSTIEEDRRRWEAEFGLAQYKAYAPEPGKAPADIETYARDVLAGRLSLSGIPADIRTQVSRRVDELRRGERIYTDEQIRAELRGWIMDIKARETETTKYTDGEIKSAVGDAITKSNLTDPDRERFNLILGEIMPVTATKGVGERMWEWLKTH